MRQQEYLDQFEASLMDSLLTLCREAGYISGKMPATDDITNKWDSMSPSYIKDALHEINDYPLVALGWAMYVGMAVARYWDTDWNIYGRHANLYEHLRDKRGFDYLDEVVRGEILGLTGEDFLKIEDLVRRCARHVQDKIRHEQIEPSSVMAFYAFARSVYVLYQIGAAVELERCGYKMEKVG